MVTRISTQIKLGIMFALGVSLCSAAGSLASVTSAEAFSVDGITLSNPGVSSWPLISNDEIATKAAGALLTFRDGSAIKLAPLSRIKLGGTEAAPQVLIMAGNLESKIAPGSKLMITRAIDATDKDTGTNTTLPVDATTGAARSNNNIPFRNSAILYMSSGVALGGLGVATDAVLQPAAVSTR
jgi:hypothetical protein